MVYRRGYDLVMLKTFPHQYEGEDDGSETFRRNLERDQMKLILYYSVIEFLFIPGSEYFALYLNDPIPDYVRRGSKNEFIAQHNRS